MTTTERREEILCILKASDGAVSATALSSSLNVSRQIIVGDVAILRASGVNIYATHRGYVLEEKGIVKDMAFVGIIACKHEGQLLAEELYSVVDFGGTVIDVIVDHPIYGQISGSLNISSRYDADIFVQKISKPNSEPLSKLTGGIHIHTIGCKDLETFEMIKDRLRKNQILVEA